MGGMPGHPGVDGNEKANERLRVLNRNTQQHREGHYKGVDKSRIEQPWHDTNDQEPQNS